MKTKAIVILIYCVYFPMCCLSQIVPTPGTSAIGTGYFNGHQFATFGTITGTPPTLTGNLAGNPFTIAFSNNARSSLSIFSPYGPSLPANSGTFSTATVDLNYTAVPATSTITFTNVLQPLDQMHIIDLESSESATFQFLDASNNPLNIVNNIKVVPLSTVTPTASVNLTNATTVGINTDPGTITVGNTDQGFSFIMLTNLVKAIRFTQTNPSNSTGSWDFTFSRGTPDRGDAPASYGDATHLTLANRLRMGANGGDAEAGTLFSATATGDNAASSATVINDEDGVSTITPIANNGAFAQIIPTYSITTTVSNSIGAAANIVAWIDWNGNGTFDATEAVVGTAVANGSNNVSRTFTWNNVTLNGAAGRAGTFLRLRTTTGTLTAANPSGFAPDGEVEDYFIPFLVALPVTFGDISAIVKNDAVYINWSTLSENNNDHFEIEVSTNGKDFKKLPEIIKTKATNGNSDTPLNYNYVFPYSTGAALLGFFAFLLVIGTAGFKRRKIQMAIVVLVVTTFLYYGCSKSDGNEISNTPKNIFVRIAQVDKDGTNKYSIVVKAVKE